MRAQEDGGIPTVLSHIAGELEAGVEAKKYLCYLSDERLLVAEGQMLNAHVQSYMFRLTRLGRKYKTEVVDVDVIRLTYEGSSGEKIDHTQMQRNAKQLLVKACRENASDIHIRMRKYSTDVYFRIYNDLVRVSNYSREYGERLLSTLYGAMTDVSDTSYKPNDRQDARIGDRDKLPEELHGVRIATAPTVDGAVMVLRLLYNDAGGSDDLKTLGFTDDQVRMLEVVKDAPSGMSLIGGPTGSGKSTSLQRLLLGQIRLSGGKLCVVTVEDPPEYPIEGSVQTPVKAAATDEERTKIFAHAISNAMRLDPDIIMIGEIRDYASAQLSLRAAMTGHQLWSTVHVNNALAIIDRLVDLGLPLSMIADPTLINCLMCQRLMKVLCPACKLPLHLNRQTISTELFERTRHAIGRRFNEVCVTGSGCEKCKGRGTTGRTVVAEIVLPDETLFDLLRSNQKHLAREYWLKQGGKTMLDHAIEKIADGYVDPFMAENIVGRLDREDV